MKYEIKIDPKQTEPKVVITTNNITEEISELIKILDNKRGFLVGYKEKTMRMLNYENIIHFYTYDRKVLAATKNDAYEVKQRLYDLEEALEKYCFVRISNTEIINLKQVVEFSLEFNGFVSVLLKNNIKTYVSRRNVKKIKKILQIGGN
ncbi:MAG: LytTR family DNA-binding domain-containing protein [Breznakia sp.]